MLCSLVFLCAVFSASEASPICPENELYKFCGTGCEPSCAKPFPKVCTLQCVTGCQCKEGWFRNAQGTCVTLTQCGYELCGEHRVYNPCGSACPLSCLNPKPRACPSVCVEGCDCETGYYKNDKDQCVTLQDCGLQLPIQSCGANAEFKRCGTACPPSCKNPRPGACTEQCVAECQCKEGYLQHRNGLCVKEYQCHQQNDQPKVDDEEACGENAEFLTCGSTCPPSCNDTTPGPCLDVCVPRCQCKDEYYENNQGLCVKKDQCHQQNDQPKVDKKACGKNAQYKECGTACPPTCNNTTPAPCIDQCVAECQCVKDYFKDSNGHCVKLDECDRQSDQPKQNKSCGAYAKFKACGTACPPTCENPTPDACTKQCVAECQCDKDYFKDSKGRCVKLDECDRQSDQPKQNKSCGDYAEFNACGTACPPTCDNPTPDACTKPCVAECQCKKGYYQHSNGLCVELEQCEQQNDQPGNGAIERESCGDHEEFKFCGTACPPTCKKPIPPQVCTEQCVTGCHCKTGYYRNAYTQCVTLSQCKPSLDVFYQKTGPNRSCKACTDDCAADIGQWKTKAECEESSRSARVFYQKSGPRGACKECEEGLCIFFLAQYLSKAECEAAPKTFYQKAGRNGACVACQEGFCVADLRQFDTEFECVNAPELPTFFFQKTGPGGSCKACDENSCAFDIARYNSLAECKQAEVYYQKTGPRGSCKPCNRGSCVQDIGRWNSKEECNAAAPRFVTRFYFQKTGPNGYCEACEEEDCFQDIGRWDTRAECETAPDDDTLFFE